MIKFLYLLSLATAIWGVVLPNTTRQVTSFSEQGVTLGSAQLTAFTDVENVEPRGRPNGAFAINRLQLLQFRGRQPIRLGFYAIQLTRAESTARFRAEEYTPSNSETTIEFVPVGNEIGLRVEVRPSFNTDIFTYDGIVKFVSGASPTANTVNIDQIESVAFSRAVQNSTAGTFVRFPIARLTTSAGPTSNLGLITSQPVQLSTTPPSPLASSFEPGQGPIQAADNVLSRSFISRPELAPYFTISTAFGRREPIEVISLTAAQTSTFFSSGVRAFVGDCVGKPVPLTGSSQIIRYLNDPVSTSQLRSCGGAFDLRPAFECEQMTFIRGFSRERVEFYCGHSRQSYGFIYVTTGAPNGETRVLAINEITVSRNA